MAFSLCPESVEKVETSSAVLHRPDIILFTTRTNHTCILCNHNHRRTKRVTEQFNCALEWGVGVGKAAVDCR